MINWANDLMDNEFSINFERVLAYCLELSSESKPNIYQYIVGSIDEERLFPKIYTNDYTYKHFYDFEDLNHSEKRRLIKSIPTENGEVKEVLKLIDSLNIFLDDLSSSNTSDFSNEKIKVMQKYRDFFVDEIIQNYFWKLMDMFTVLHWTSNKEIGKKIFKYMKAVISTLDTIEPKGHIEYKIFNFLYVQTVDTDIPIFIRKEEINKTYIEVIFTRFYNCYLRYYKEAKSLDYNMDVSLLIFKGASAGLISNCKYQNTEADKLFNFTYFPSYIGLYETKFSNDLFKDNIKLYNELKNAHIDLARDKASYNYGYINSFFDSHFLFEKEKYSFTQSNFVKSDDKTYVVSGLFKGMEQLLTLIIYYIKSTATNKFVTTEWYIDVFSKNSNVIINNRKIEKAALIYKDNDWVENSTLKPLIFALERLNTRFGSGTALFQNLITWVDDTRNGYSHKHALLFATRLEKISQINSIFKSTFELTTQIVNWTADILQKL